MAPFRRICCPVDFTRGSRAALEMAADLARRDQALLTLLHVTRARWPGDQGAVVPGPEPAREELETFERWTADAGRLAGGTVSSVLLSAPAAEAIVGFARDDATDLLVMASHGRTGLRRLALGSVAEAVLRSAPCPVLVLRWSDAGAGNDQETGMPA